MINQGCRAQVLSKHVLVKVSIDESAAFGEEFVEVGDGHIVSVDVAHFELALGQGTLGWLGELRRQRQRLLLCLGLSKQMEWL